MTDEKVRSERRDERAAKRAGVRSFRIAASPALVALFAVVSLIAAFAYGISAWQVYGFAANVWGVPEPLRYASAVIADLLSLAGLFATYLLRTAAKHVRAYAWFVFLAMTGLSIAAAESFAHWRSLDPISQAAATQHGGVASQIASGAVVVSLALAVHLLIVVRRHVSPEQESAPAIATAPVAALPRHIATPAETAAGRAPVTERPARPTAPPAPSVATRPRRASGRPATGSADRHADAVRRVVEDQHPAKDVAAELGVSRRAVELWVKAYRERQSGDPLAAASTIAGGISDPPQVNGHAFTPGAATEAQVN